MLIGFHGTVIGIPLVNVAARPPNVAERDRDISFRRRRDDTLFKQGSHRRQIPPPVLPPGKLL